MSWFGVFVISGLFLEVSGLMLPMTKPDGSVDMSSVVHHVTVLEQTVTMFQEKTTQLESDLQTTKTENHRSDVEISSLKDELTAVKAELVMTSDELISANSEIAALKTKFLSLEASGMNQTVLDSISYDVKSNMADIKSVKHALGMTNSSLETFVTQIRDLNSTTTATTTELQRQQNEVKSDISNLSSTLAQIQSNVTSTVSDFYHVKDSVMVVQTQLNTTTSDINLIKSDVASIRRNVSGFEAATQSVTQMFQATEADLETIKSSLQDQQSQLTSIQNSTNNQLQTIKSDLALKTKTVAFSAQSSGTHTSSQPVKFDQVQYNEGNGYSNTTGVFTAPVSGTYMFFAQVELYGDHLHNYLQIMKSGSIIATSFGETSTSTSINHVTIPVTTVMYVGQGQEVWMQSSSNIDDGKSTYFVGALVSAN